jgi:HAD superfamily hydrolase (TIGR01490 family)
MMGRVVFFDLDKTLIDCHSANNWLWRELRFGHITYFEALKGVWWLLKYKLGFARMEDSIRQAIQGFQGQKEVDVKNRISDFWDEDIQSRLRPRAEAIMQKHLEEGDVLALITGSSFYLAQIFGDKWGFTHIVANRFLVDGEFFTGEAQEPLCYGEGKVHYAEQIAAEHGVELDECIFYTDSISDLPLLEKVGSPIAVHPDYHLKKLARKRGWEIALWS